MKIIMSRLKLVAAFALLVGCATKSPVGPDMEQHISWVASVSLPDTATIGVEFQVLIHTYGGYNNSYKGEDLVTPIEGGFQITPYDWERVGLFMKNRALVTYQHVDPFTVFEPGMLKINVLHQQYSAETSSDTTGTIYNEVVLITGGLER